MAKGKGQKARIIRSKMIYSGPVFGIRRDELIEPGGVRTTREMITHSGSVVVLPVLPDGRVLLVRQYRHAARQFLWELVAGRIDEGESPRKAAAREKEVAAAKVVSFYIHEFCIRDLLPISQVWPPDGG